MTLPTRASVLASIAADPGLRALHAEVRGGEDSAHDEAHLLRVAVWTLRIGGADIDAREALGAALLHDLVNVPKDHPDRARASELSAEAARPLLTAAGFGAEAVARMADAIRDHSFSRGAVPTSALGRALQDADRLEALGAIGIARTFATGQRMGARFFHPEDPFGRARALDDRAFSVDHFYKKLLGLTQTMRTARGRAEAERRTALLRDFLSALADELGEDAAGVTCAPEDRP